MSLISKIKLEDFLDKHRSMSIRPLKNDGLIVEGKLYFTAKTDGFREVEDFYKIRIKVANNFPSAIPEVEEIGNKIPRKEEYHINPDNTLCLGSSLTLLQLLSKKPTLEGFIEYCLVPYLYGISLKIQDGGKLVFGELAHGEKGIIDEYEKIFGIRGKDSLKQLIKMLSMKKRVANKQLCPCGCKNRLGKCNQELNIKINQFRYFAARSWYKKYEKEIFKEA